MKKYKAIVAVLLLAALVVAGFFAIASDYGTTEDPLVSLSYIESVLAPQIDKKVDEIIDEKVEDAKGALYEKIGSLSGVIDDKITEYTSKSADEILTDSFVQSVADKIGEKATSQSGTSTTFTLVDVPAGKTLTAKVGCEMVLRVGTGTCVASGSPGLIDLTTGADLAGGRQLEKNHLYLCTIDGRGVKANANVKILVRGPYTVA